MDPSMTCRVLQVTEIREQANDALQQARSEIAKAEQAQADTCKQVKHMHDCVD